MKSYEKDMHYHNKHILLGVLLCSSLMAASVYAVPAVAAHKKNPTKDVPISTIQKTIPTASTSSATSSAAVTTKTTPAATPAPTAKRVFTVLAQGGAAPVQLIHDSGVVNVYARKGNLSPLQTAELLFLSIILGLLGYMFTQGVAFGSLYAWFARMIGIKPVPKTSHV